MKWLVLFIAGLLEITWSVAMKYAAGFTKPVPSVIAVAGVIASMVCLALALKSLPLGTAYAVWTGIGIAGTFVCGALLFHEPAGAVKIISTLLVIAGIIGLRL